MRRTYQNAILIQQIVVTFLVIAQRVIAQKYIDTDLTQPISEVVDVIAWQRVHTVLKIAFSRAFARTCEVTLQCSRARVLHADCISVISPGYDTG